MKMNQNIKINPLSDVLKGKKSKLMNFNIITNLLFVVLKNIMNLKPTHNLIKK